MFDRGQPVIMIVGHVGDLGFRPMNLSAAQEHEGGIRDLTGAPTEIQIFPRVVRGRLGETQGE
jgi:hypothetical protein